MDLGLTPRVGLETGLGLTPRIGLPPAALASAFPFHVVFDHDGVVLQSGEVIRRLVPSLVHGESLSQCFRIRRPAATFDVESISAAMGSLFLLEAVGRVGLTLKGQMLLLDASEAIAFVGSPWVTDVGQIKDLELSLRDFAIHDPVSDYLFLLQTQKTSLADAERLADELGRLNRGLEERILERTRELSDTNQRLAMKSAQLESSLRKVQETQEQLVQAAKLGAVGHLAAGLAHEINNPLGVILGFAQGLAERLPEDEGLHMPVASIVREALRCKALVQELLTFARTAKRTAEDVDPNELLRGVSQLLEARAGTQGTKVLLELDTEVPFVRANRGQLHQVMVNLGNNALDAVQAGGTVLLRSRMSGGAVRLEVEDTGLGIPDEVQPHVFEPFFTTKDVGKGTGLGLSLAHEIVEQHGGRIDIETEAGRGTCIAVLLPAGGDRHRAPKLQGRLPA